MNKRNGEVGGTEMKTISISIRRNEYGPGRHAVGPYQTLVEGWVEAELLAAEMLEAESHYLRIQALRYGTAVQPVTAG